MVSQPKTILGDAFGADIEQQLLSIFEAMSDGVWVCDATPRLLWINSACEALNNIKREEVCGRTVSELLGRGNFDTDVTSRVLKEKKPVAILQKVKSGRTLLVNGVPVFGASDKIIYVVGSERDMTELNMLREEIEQKQQLNSRINSELLALKVRDSKFGEFVAVSEIMQRVLETALRVSTFDTTVLLTGPSGSGKTLIARMIHEGSNRRTKPFLTLNCGAIPPSLVEAELFGYVAGAFSGAQKDGKPGLIEVTDGGTLFLDEIDAFPLEAQVKLLTFLDSKGFIRIGDTKVRQVDVRLIVATNRDLEELVEQGHFREDLWFRLNVVPMTLPPLKGRPEDILVLVQQLLDKMSEQYGITRGISRNALDSLCKYEFPGNVRELENILERSFVLCQGSEITVEDLPPEVRATGLPIPRAVTTDTSLKEILDGVERQYLHLACQKHTRQSDIAQELGLSQPTVARLLKKHRLKPAIA